MATSTLIEIGLLIAALWLMFSPDPLADVIRVRLLHAKSVAIRKLDSAVARQESAVATAELAKSKAETALLQLKTARNVIKLQLVPFDETIANMDRAARRAGVALDKDSVAAAVKKMQDAQADSAGIRKQAEAADARVNQLTIDIDALDTEIKIRRAKLADAKSRAADASSSKEIYTIVSDLDDAGSVRNQQKSEEILVEAEAEAMTYKEQADLKIAHRREDAKLEALGRDETPVSTDDLVAKYMGQSSK